MNFSSLLTEYSVTLAEVTWTELHILRGSTVLVMFMLKSYIPVTVKGVVPLPDYFDTYLIKLKFACILNLNSTVLAISILFL